MIEKWNFFSNIFREKNSLLQDSNDPLGQTQQSRQ